MQLLRAEYESHQDHIIGYPAVTAGLVCAALVLIADVLRPEVFRIFAERQYLVVHIALEFASIVVAYSVFAVGWYAYKQNHNAQDLYIAVAFMITGAIDFAHALSYEGMPPVFTANTVSKASTYWVAARFFTALSLLIAAFVRPDSRKPWMKPRVLFPAGVVTAIAVIVPIGYWHESLPAMFVSGQGQTTLKIATEYVIIALLALATLAFGKYGRRERASVDLLQVALVISIFSELAFTLYASAFDAFNLIGHLLKVAAYYFILRALFVSSLQRPYAQLVEAREELGDLVRETGELYDQADRQRARLEHSFAQIGSALGSSLELDRTLELIAELAADMMAADAVVVGIPDDERPVFRIRASRGLASGQRTIPMHDSVAAEAVQEMSAQRVTDVSTSSRLWRPRLAKGQARSVLSAPIMLEGKVTGVLTMYSIAPGAFSRHDEELMMTLATQAAVAVDNAARFERERRIAQTFQRRLLPLVPRVKGIELAARYAPASPSAEVGGDLYDAILLDSRRLALAIGDVSGKGLDAATIMASTQYMMRGFLFQGMQPGEVLSSLQSAMTKELDPAQFITIFVSVLDLETYELSYANAGHPFPVVMTSEGCDSMVGHNSGPVGVPASLGAPNHEGKDLHWAITERDAYVTDRMKLPRDFGLVFYTDGILDARSNGEFFGVERMLDICRQAGDASSEEIVERLLAAASQFTGGKLPDDIALLAARSPRLPAGPVTWDI